MNMFTLFKTDHAIKRLFSMVFAILIIAKVYGSLSHATALLHMVDLQKLCHRHLIVL
jgi:hypothetical protein